MKPDCQQNSAIFSHIIHKTFVTIKLLIQQHALISTKATLNYDFKNLNLPSHGVENL